MYQVEPLKNIDFGATGAEEILQNVAFILSTPIMSCPLDREFGFDYSFIDGPIDVAKARYTAAVVEAISKFEPRVIIEEVEISGDGLKAKLTPKVRVRINDESL